MSEPTRRAVPGYLSDDVTVGELMRWLNAEITKAGRERNLDCVSALCDIGEKVEAAITCYRLSSANHKP